MSDDISRHRPTPTNVAQLRPRGAYAALKVVRAHSRASGPPRAVLTVLATYADDDGRARPTLPTIVRDSGLSTSTVQRALKALVGQLAELEVVARSPGRGVATVYRIRLEDLVARADTHPVENPVIPGLEDVPKGGHPDTLPVRKVVTVTSQGGHPDHPRTIDRPLPREGLSLGFRCAAHAHVENPPPCHGCREARERAQDETAEQARQALDERRRLAIEEARREAERTKAAAVHDPAVIAAARAAIRRN